MCGFVGFINKDSDTEIMNTVTVHQMTDRILHRGPDQEGYYVDSDVKNVLSDEFRTKVHPENPAFYTRPYFNECENEDDISKMQYVDIRTWLVQDILVKADRMSMANSLELRVPFLDKNVLDVAMHIPSKYRIAGGTTKYILRKAAERSLPPETAGMVKKVSSHLLITG